MRIVALVAVLLISLALLARAGHFSSAQPDDQWCESGYVCR